jgi:mannose-6-phosphate isomerase-like protein (cupin superfamily)
MKLDLPIAFLSGQEIGDALNKEYRQYLAGDLKKEQKHLPFILDDIEVGMSYYQQFTADAPHMHPIATEHGYILQGAVRVKRLDKDNEEYEFHTGDFFVIQKGIPYASKCMAETKVLFIKSPGINDKTVVEIDEAAQKWLSAWDI